MTPTRPRILLRTLAWILVLPALMWLVQPWPLAFRWKNPGTTAFMDARLQQARAGGDSLVLVYTWVPLDELPEVLVRAVLVAEDDRFRDHGGVDWVALAEEVRYRGSLPPDLRNPVDRAALAAAWQVLREDRDEIRGRSTLTQQLARNLYLSETRSFVRKGQEFLLARRLEFFLDKDRILELYLNVAEFGPGIFGVEAASQAYFRRSARDLTLFQAASLAGTLPHPLTSNPAHQPGRMAWRRDRIVQRLGGGPPVPILPPEPVPILLPPPSDPPPPSGDVPLNPQPESPNLRLLPEDPSPQVPPPLVRTRS